jgi:hypothetical protein
VGFARGARVHINAGAGNFLNFLFHAPLIFTGCCFYTVGFARGARVHINKKT